MSLQNGVIPHMSPESTQGTRQSETVETLPSNDPAFENMLLPKE